MWPLRLEEELLLRGLKRVPAAVKLMSLWSRCNETNTRRSGHWAPLESQKLSCLTQEAAVCVHVCPLRYHTQTTHTLYLQKYCCDVVLMEVTHSTLAFSHFRGKGPSVQGLSQANPWLVSFSRLAKMLFSYVCQQQLQQPHSCCRMHIERYGTHWFGSRSDDIINTNEPYQHWLVTKPFNKVLVCFPQSLTWMEMLFSHMPKGKHRKVNGPV